MTTYNQLCHKAHSTKFRKGSPARALECSPFKKGIVSRVRIMKPKKPNSAMRKTAKVQLSTGRSVNCYIPGLGHNLRDFSQVLVRGGPVKDLPGIQYHIIRGRLEFDWKERIDRQKKLTRRGVPKPDKRKDY